MIGGHKIHPPIAGVLPKIDIKPLPFQNSASKVTGSQAYADNTYDVGYVKKNLMHASNTHFFNSASVLLFNELSLKCCLSIAYYI